MEEVNNNQPAYAVESVPAVPTESVSQAVATPAYSPTYGGFLARFLAALLDGLMLGIVLMPFGLSTFEDGTLSVNTPGSIIMMAYAVFMNMKFGGTLGKKIMKIRVQDMATGENLSLPASLLRETVGKFVSALPIFLGFFWMLWDKDKQTWHDKIAKSVVVKL